MAISVEASNWSEIASLRAMTISARNDNKGGVISIFNAFTRLRYRWSSWVLAWSLVDRYRFLVLGFGPLIDQRITDPQ